MNRLNIEIVKKAITEIRATGEYPSFKAILAHVGYGSYSTLTKLKAQYPNIFDHTIVATVDTDHTPYDTVNPLNTTQSDTRIDILERQLQQVLKRLYMPTDSTQLKTPNAQLKRELLKTQNELSNSLSELELERRKNIVLQEKLEANKEGIEDLETNVKQLEVNLKQSFEKEKASSERLSEVVDELESLQAQLERLKKKRLELEETLEEANEQKKDYKDSYFRLIKENARLKDGLWPSEDTPDGFKKLSVSEIVLAKNQRDKFKKFAQTQGNLSQSEAVSKLIKLALDSQDERKDQKQSKPASINQPKKPNSNEAKIRLKELKAEYPDDNNPQLAQRLADEGFLNSKGDVYGRDVIHKWLHPEKYGSIK